MVASEPPTVRSPPSSALAACGLVLAIFGAAGCDWIWPTHNPHDPFRCQPACTGGKECQDGVCVASDGGQGSDTRPTAWEIRSWGGASDTEVNAMAVDGSGNAYIAGRLEGSTPLGTFQLKSGGAQDIFVARVSPAGEVLWAHAMGGRYIDWAHRLALDSKGHLYLAGYFMGNASFGTHQLEATGKKDILVLKMETATGKVLWASHGGGIDYDEGRGLAVNDSGDAIYCSGGGTPRRYSARCPFQGPEPMTSSSPGWTTRAASAGSASPADRVRKWVWASSWTASAVP